MKQRRIRRYLSILAGLAVLLPLLAVSSGSAASAGLPGPSAFVYVSSSSAGSVDGNSFTSGDVLVYDTILDSWAVAFDAASAGVGGGNVDGFSVADDGSYLLSFTGAVSVPGVGLVDDSDVVSFDPGSGAFAMLIDASDVQLTSGGEDIDAIVSAGPTVFALSTLGSFNVPASGSGSLTGPDEDVIELDAALTGPFTAGDFTRLFDGSDVGLSSEDLNAGHLDGSTGVLYWSVANSFSVGGVSGDGGDVVAFTGSFGDNTSGTHTLVFDASAHRWGGEVTDALYWKLQEPPAPGSADLRITKQDDADPVAPGQTVAYTIDVTNDGPDPAQNVVVTDLLPTGLTLVGTSSACQGGTLPCALGDIPANQTVTVTITVMVDAGAAGTLTNVSSVASSTADPNPSNNEATETTYVGRLPQAVDDGPATNSAPGNPFHTAADTTLTSGPAENLLDNDDGGDPPASVVGFEGMNFAGDTATFPEGVLTVNADGSFIFDPNPGFAGLFDFDYRIGNSLGESVATVSIFVGDRPAAMNQDVVFVTSPTDGVVDGIAFTRADILAYDAGEDSWGVFVNGSSVGIGTANIDAISVLGPEEVLMSFAGGVVLPGIGPVDDSDVVLLTMAPNTPATWSLVVDGSTVGLTSGGEDVDALGHIPAGGYLLSTLGGATVPATGGGNLSATDEDVIQLSGSAFDIVFDGSDVDMAQEDTNGVHLDPESGTLYGVSLNGFDAAGLTGDGNDIWSFAGTTGSTTTGTFGLFLDLDAVGYTNNINGLSLRLSPPDEYDFGDAPASYGVTVADDGARHLIGGPALGSSVDAEQDGQPSATADGDDLDGSDDEDGVTITGPIQSGVVESVTVTASGPGLLNVWIDSDFDGTWDGSEQVVTDLAVIAGDNDVEFSVPPVNASGPTVARFRLSTAGGDLPTGAAADGEVEDYQVTLAAEASITAIKVLGGNADEDGSSSVSLGDTLVFSIVARNDGGVTLTDVTVDDDLTGTVDTPCAASLAPDEVCEVNLPYTVTQGDVDAGVINNTGTVEGNPPIGDPVTDDDGVTVPVPQTADLGVDKVLTGNADQDGTFDISLGDTLEYTITATNDGNVTLTNVDVADDLTGTSTACASVAPGQTCVLTALYTVTETDVAAGEIVNTGSAESDQTPQVEDPNTQPVAQNPSMSIGKVFTGNVDEDGSASVTLGDTLQYTLTATNTGGSNLTNVVVSDDLTGDSTTCPLVVSGGTCVLTTDYRVDQVDVDAGQVENVGSADSDQAEPVTDPEIVPVEGAAVIDALKVYVGNDDADGSGTITVRDTLTYTIVATNDGDLTLAGITVDDELTGTVDAPCAASLAPGEDCTVDVEYTVTQADVDAGRIDNQGTVEGISPAGDLVTDSDDESVLVPQNPSMSIDKLLSRIDSTDGERFTSAVDAAGDVIVYEMVVSNDGDVSLTNIVITDPLLADLSCPSATLLVNGSMSCFGSYEVTQGDLDDNGDGDGDIDNTASADSDQTVPVSSSLEVPLTLDLAILADKVLFDNADEDGNGEVSLGDTLTFRITATNSGNVTLTSVTVQDILTNTVGALCAPSLAPGGSCFVDVTYTVTQADVAAGQIDNTGQVQGDPPTGSSVVDDDTVSVDVPQTDTETTSAGGGQGINVSQPSLVLNPYIRIIPAFPSPAGDIRWSAAVNLPDGTNMVKADGRALSRTTYADLFAEIGTIYGAGDGSTTFNIPDLRGRAVVGTSGTRALGSVTGSATTSLVEANLPNHEHGFANGFVASAVGSGQPFSIEQPTIALHHEIIVAGTFPSTNSLSPGATLAEVVVTAGTTTPRQNAMSANGALLPVSANQSLFALLGTTFGGNGNTTFAVPNLDDRVVVGRGLGPGLSNRFLGTAQGSSSVTLTESKMPAHTHQANNTTSDPVGGSTAISLIQPELTLRPVVALTGTYPASADSLGSANAPTLGEVAFFAGTYDPRGWTSASGQLLPIQQRLALFSLLATVYGGDGETTFALPDLRGRTMVGSGTSGSQTFTTGQRYGTETTILTVGQLAPHSHPVVEDAP